MELSEESFVNLHGFDSVGETYGKSEPFYMHLNSVPTKYYLSTLHEIVSQVEIDLMTALGPLTHDA